MDYLTDITEASTAITAFIMANGSSLDTELGGQLVEIASSPAPVDRVCNTAELLYARQADVGAAGRRLAAQLALFGAANGWQHLRDGRGRDMAYAMMRRNGYSPPDGVTFQPASEDPDPLPQFVAPEAPAEEPPAPTP